MLPVISPSKVNKSVYPGYPTKFGSISLGENTSVRYQMTRFCNAKSNNDISRSVAGARAAALQQPSALHGVKQQGHASDGTECPEETLSRGGAANALLLVDGEEPRQGVGEGDDD